MVTTSVISVAGDGGAVCDDPSDPMDVLSCWSGPSGGVPPIFPSLQDLECELDSTITDFVTCVRAAMPPAASGLYTPPSFADAQDFAFVVEQMMTDMDDGVFDCDASVPPSLDEHYRVVRFESNDREFCVLYEFRDADVDGYADLGWGTFLYAPDAHNELCIQAPHPHADLYTAWQAAETFEQTHARSALIAGAHREANTVSSPCQGYLTDADGDPYYEADVAHNIDPFYVASKTIAAYHGAQEAGGVVDFSGAAPGFHVLQFHSMGLANCGSVHVLVSNGDRSELALGDGALQLVDALHAHNPQWGIAHPGDGMPDCGQVGSTNTLARYFNGVTDEGSNEISNPVCGYEGVAPDLDPYLHPNVSARLIHIEQKKCIQGTSCQRSGPDAIRSAEAWAAAISETFDVPTCTDGSTNGDEDGVDCGGACPVSC
ncbi:hypothetical protein [Paraliomyxa miuraensis]|uniref:hypothetical protein n=1 Tax=Paraliomyxa miuraensis TaxID=376150 RepID=UPI00225AF410|nr:hypothetical protein [Paraliomyxa miuraensis]MCX4242873.1 hypothetical protein [Paraliomyxa miuraensis]